MLIKQATACLVLLLVVFSAGMAMAAEDITAQTEDFYSRADQLRHEALQQNETCFSCHGKSDISTKWVTDRGRTLQLHVDPVDFRNSVHSGQNCQSCHEGEGADAFSAAPHKFKNEKPLDCQTCHEDYFKDIADQTKRSYHTKAIVEKGKEFPCASCHDAHTFRQPERTEEIPANIAQANERCFSCHNDYRGYEKLTDKKLLDQKMGHWFLPHKEKHFAAVRCVDCHADNQGEDVHVIMQVKDSEMTCETCHSKSSALTTKLNTYRNEQRAFSMVGKNLFDDTELIAKNKEQIAAGKGKADSELGFMNAKLLDDKYVTGITQTPWLNSKFIQILTIILLAIGAHALLRVFGTKAKYEDEPEIAMFPALVRIWHWANVILFVVLIITGFSMHYDGGMKFEPAQSVHATFALALVGLWTLYLVYLILSGQLMQYLPRRDFFSALGKQAGYYLLGIYKGKKNPAGHDPAKRLNAMQQVAYISVLFVFFPMLIGSGLAMFIPEIIPAQIMGMDGERFVSMAHTAAAFLMIIFIVVHLYLCTTGETVTALFKSMITGKITHKNKK